MKDHAAQDSGTALVVAMLLMLVFTVMLIGFFFVTSGEQQVAANTRDNEVTYYGAVAALEQMSSLIANYFAHTAAPTPSQIVSYTTSAANYPIPLPEITSTTYTLYCMAPPSPQGAQCSQQQLQLMMVLCSTVSGNGLGNCYGPIGGNGPLAGLQGVITPFQLTVTADGPSNTEVKLNRTVQEVAVPIFEFGIFSDSDLSFFAGKDFNFGGRVHTNGNLFLAEDSTGTLNLNDHVTAAGGIIRNQLSNGYVMATYPSTTCSSSKYCSYVNVLTTSNGCPSGTEGSQSGNCRSLGFSEGSVEAGAGSTEYPNWQTLSNTTYNGFIQDGTTGAKVLNIAIALPGINSQPIAMIQRPPAGESTTGALGIARFFNQASLRILLSDTQDDIMNLLGIDTSEYPYPLAEAGSPGVVGVSGASSGTTMTISRSTSIPSTYCPKGGPCYLPPADACHPPLAESVGSTTDNDYMTAAGTTLLGGWIKIEMQCAATAGCPGTWKDVTEEILAQGISRDEGSGTAMAAPTTLTTATTGGTLAQNKTYYYVVTAVNAYGESAGTETQKQTANSTSTNTITLSGWPAVTNATGYNVYRGTSAGGETGFIGGATCGSTPCTVSGGTTTSYTDTGAALTAQTPPSSSCTNTSIIHLEEAAPGVTLTSSSASNLMNVLTPTKFVPINMYDAREGEVRDPYPNGLSTSSLNGIMNLVEVDVGNLQQWFAGNIATSGKYAFNGPDALNNSGFILYTSDRRMNCMDGAYDLEGTCTANSVSSTTGLPTAGESGEFGNEDIINPSSPTGAPNGQLDTCTTGVTACPPEDVDGDGVFRTYGAYAHPIAAPSTSVTPSGTSPSGETWSTLINSLSSTTNNPAFVRITNTQAQKNSVVVFRRALRLMNGAVGNLPPLAAAQATTCSGGTAGGFTVASENPIYVAGDYNASPTNGFTDVSGACHVPASVIGDAVTLLSDAWTLGAQSGTGDANSFLYPTNCTKRMASSTYFRMAVMGGKTNSFPEPSWGNFDAGTDGGVHNFLRLEEDWESATTNYLGSLASFYLSRQATGIFKSLGTVYKVATRNYTFDTDFQSISKLPPGTPRFTDVNALSYYQSTLASQ